MALLSDPAVQTLIVYSTILALKMSAMSALTAITRMIKKSFVNPEDANLAKGKIRSDDPDVERVRRAHLNDLENIPMFWLLGACYLATGPNGLWAQMLFRTYAISRIAHTFVYAVKPMQPARAITFGIGTLIQWYMVFQIIVHFSGAL